MHAAEYYQLMEVRDQQTLWQVICHQHDRATDGCTDITDRQNCGGRQRGLSSEHTLTLHAVGKVCITLNCETGGRR